MTPEERSNLACLHALSLLEGEEALLAARLEASDPEFAAEVAAFEEGSSIMAAAIEPVQPTNLLRERVLSLTGVPRKTGSSWIGWAAAAAVALAAVWLWNSREEDRKEIADLHAEISRLGNDNSLADLRIASLEGQLEQYKGTRAVVVWNQSKHEGQIQLANLPPAEQGKDYQLWVVDPAYKNPISAGLIERNSDGTANVRFQPVQMIRDATAFAISVEKSGGVEVAEGPIVILGK